MDKLEKFEIDPATFLREHFTLSPLPDAVLKIQEIVNNEYVGVEAICELLLNEPVLSAHILKLVNSAYYGFRREVDDIKFAVAYLGIREIYNIVLSSSVVENLGVTEIKVLEKFWTHSIFTALCAKHLCRKFEPLLSPDRIWLGAILHDIGKLVYYRFFPDHYLAIVEFSKKKGCLSRDAEKYFSFPRSSVMGSVLCERWRLPSIVKDACECHSLEDLDTLDGGSRTDFKKIICSANLMSVLAADELNNDLKHEIFDKLAKKFNYSEKDFLKLMGEIYDLKIEVDNYRW